MFSLSPRAASERRTNLSELADIADFLALQGLEIRSNSAVLEVDNPSEGLVQERSDRLNGKIARFGLYP